MMLKLYITVIAMILAAPLILSFAGVGTELTYDQRRDFRPPPSFSSNPARAVTHYNDIFVKKFFPRSELTALYASVKHTVMGELPVQEQVVQGKDNFLFYANATDCKPMQQYQRIIHYTVDELDDMRRTATSFRDFLISHNIILYVLIVPDKETVYSDKIPDTIKVLGDRSRTDQVVDMLHESGITTIDTRDLLIEKRTHSHYDLYYKTDTHWNDLGAYYAYSELIRVMSEDFPELKPVKIRSITAQPYSNGGDLNKILGLTNNLHFRNIVLEHDRQYRTTQDASHWNIVTESKDKLPRIVVIRDSCTNALIPYLSNNFSFARYIFLSRNTVKKIKQKSIINRESILKDKPDIVLIEFVERYLFILSRL